MSEDINIPFSNISINENNTGDIRIPSGSTLEVKFIDGKKEGPAFVYSPLTIKLAHLYFHKDMLHGFCMYFNERGRKICECVYENGIRNGWIREYNDSKIVFTGICKNGKKVSELKNYNGKSDFFEEIQNNKRISIRKYNSDEYLDGICYCYENDKVKQVYKFQCGEKNKIMYEFDNSKMIEYNTNEMIAYIGEYEGDIENGYKRKGKGEGYVYNNGKIYEIDHMNNDNKTSYEIMDGNIMKQYENNQLKYQGGWCINNRVAGYDGEGFVYSSSSEYYKAVFDKGREVRRLMNVNGNEMILFDNEKIIYKGGFGDGYIKKGKGKRYEYEGRALKKIFSCEDGKDIFLLIELNGNRMNEFNVHGIKVYIGGFIRNTRNGDIFRNGEGSYFEKEKIVYTGDWKMGKKEGKGCYYHNNTLVYDGEWKNDIPNGKGKCFNSKGDIVYDGEWENGYGNMGFGIWIRYYDGMKCGIYDNGKIKYEGEWKEGHPDGNGRLFNKQGEIIVEGKWKNGYCDLGNDIWYDYSQETTYLVNDKGQVIYRGTISDGLPQGYGKIIKANGEVIEGEWDSGKLDIDETHFITIEDREVVMNEIASRSGLLSCLKRIKKWEILLLSDLNMNRIIYITKLTVNKENELLTVLSNKDMIGNVRKLIIADDIGNGLTCDVEISYCNCLEELVIGKNCMTNLKSIKIVHNPKLKSLETGDGYKKDKIVYEGTFLNVKEFELKDLPSLITLKFGLGTLFNLPSLVLEGIF